jgi:alcohol dehydrogenase YqhD (iron-dependent ADH family)
VKKEGKNMSLLEENLAIMRINEFQNPQRMVFGVGAAGKVGEEAKRFGADRVFVVSDENIEKAGILGNVLKALKEKSLDVKLHKISAAEPTINSANAVTSAVRSKKSKTRLCRKYSFQLQLEPAANLPTLWS